MHCQTFLNYTDGHKKNRPNLHELLPREYFYLQKQTVGYPELSTIYNSTIGKLLVFGKIGIQSNVNIYKKTAISPRSHQCDMTSQSLFSATELFTLLWSQVAVTLKKRFLYYISAICIDFCWMKSQAAMKLLICSFEIVLKQCDFNSALVWTRV